MIHDAPDRKTQADEDARRSAKIASAFAAQFGRPPEIITAAPGRVEFVGNHPDYNGLRTSNGARVLLGRHFPVSR